MHSYLWVTTSSCARMHVIMFCIFPMMLLSSLFFIVSMEIKRRHYFQIIVIFINGWLLLLNVNIFNNLYSIFQLHLWIIFVLLERSYLMLLQSLWHLLIFSICSDKRYLKLHEKVIVV